MHEEDVYIDLRDAPIEEVEKELQQRIKEAGAKGLSTEGTETLDQMINRSKSVFKIRLRSGGPAKVPTMKITLFNTKRLVKVKVRKYPIDRRRFLDQNFDELVTMGFLKVCPPSLWQQLYIWSQKIQNLYTEPSKIYTRCMQRQRPKDGRCQ